MRMVNIIIGALMPDISGQLPCQMGVRKYGTSAYSLFTACGNMVNMQHG